MSSRSVCVCVVCTFRKCYLHLGVSIHPAFFKQYPKMDDTLIVLKMLVPCSPPSLLSSEYIFSVVSANFSFMQM